MATDFKAINSRSGERRRAATKQDLLDATVRLLQAGTPLASLSIDRLVKEAGVVRTTFYLHFKDKHDLMQHLADDQVEWIGRIGHNAVDDPDLTYETVRRTLDEITTMWAANQAVLSAIIELAEYDERMHETWATAMRRVARFATGVFGEHWDKTGLEPEHPGHTAEALTWMIERCSHQLARDPATRQDISDAMAMIIWRVLHPRP